MIREGDSVIVIVPCAWTHAVGTVAGLVNGIADVHFPGERHPIPFCHYELRLSQATLF